MGNGIIKNLKFLCDCVLQVMYSDDEKCIICREEMFDDKLLCKTCEDSMKLCKDSFLIEKNGIKLEYYSVSYYSGIMMELILKLKYKSDFRSGEAIGYYMINIIKKYNLKCDYICYVPMTSSSLKKRGYNQSEFLAKFISNSINIPIIHCLDKIRQTKDQIGLSGNERWENMLGSISFVKNNNIKYKKILLIDDVITTGATAFSCISELIKNGAEEITLLTAAKSKV